MSAPVRTGPTRTGPTRTEPTRTEPTRSGTTTLHIDWTRCDGRGLCAELLPELLTRDDWGYPLARDGSRDITVPRALGRHAAEAVAACPVLALRLRRTA